MVFTAKFYLYGPIRDTKIITDSTVNIFNFPSGPTYASITVTPNGATTGTMATTGPSAYYATADGTVGVTAGAYGMTGINVSITEY